jgi:hypothetical protein
MSDSPLLDYIEQSLALSKALDRAESAASHAARVEPGWREQALEAIRSHATRNQRFLVEHVKMPVPNGVTRRAAGAIIRRAASLGWVKWDGYALDSTGAPKSCWRSLIYGGAA